MDPDERALLDAVIAAPDDDLPRLVYADWLDEHGRPERAEFIRLQCQSTRSDSDNGAARARCEELLLLNRGLWTRELPRLPGIQWGGYHRGMVHEAYVAFDNLSGRLLTPLLDSLLQWCPLRGLLVQRVQARHLPVILGWTGLGRVQELGFIDACHGAREHESEFVRQLTTHSWDDGPELIDLHRAELSDYALARLAEAPRDERFPVIRLRQRDDTVSRWTHTRVGTQLIARFGSRILI